MKSEQEVQDAARAIISFTDSYTQNRKREQNEQSKSNPSFVYIVSTLQSLENQIRNNYSRKSVIQIPKLLHSLAILVTLRLGTRLREEIDQQIFTIRHWSRECLRQIQFFGDEQDQTELVNIRYGRIMPILISTAGGVGEEQDEAIYNGLNHIQQFLRQLHKGRNEWKPYFQPLPLLFRRTEEQIEEEGASEEIEAQMKNSRYYGYIKICANLANDTTLNRFFHKS
ncbi:MAG: hypothetical protein EZS28_036223 [Streblomastix strix]|uniref:Uncharacterized protein n=1 Tax=Streblomastix strix TaxID=222440 RepID=A0A5J4UDG9_9EUKA|nr:MAG: hypothetical protein EZS28_036223 [Streblomastix strix]